MPLLSSACMSSQHDRGRNTLQSTTLLQQPCMINCIQVSAADSFSQSDIAVLLLMAAAAATSLLCHTGVPAVSI
jgi:hypothetical protein